MIYTDETEITSGNIADVLQKALPVHIKNQAEIEYLYRYYKGDQPILCRVKDVRPEINNMVVVNRANEIVTFKVGYEMGEPVQYVTRSDDPGIADKISRLNDYMASEDKQAKDAELSEWWNICGTAYRVTFPDSYFGIDEEEAPFETFVADPRYTFIVYSSGLDEREMLSVRFQKKENGQIVFYCHSASGYFEIDDTWKIIRYEPQILGIPIVEYPANKARLGSFEIVIPLLDAINTVESNRVDGIEQFIQALMLFHNVDITSEDFGKLRELGAIKFKDIDPSQKAEITYLVSQMNQSETQVLVDSMYNTVLTICGMPNRNGGSSTSDTGTAVIMRDGWSAAEARAKDTERMFKKSENKFLKLVLRICDDLADLGLKPSAIEIRFTRRNYENITEKANVLVQMLSSPKIHPSLAFISCGMFSDPQVAYRMSMEYAEEQEKKAQEQAKKQQEALPIGAKTEEDSAT